MPKFGTGKEAAVMEVVVSLVGAMIEQVQLHVLVEHVHDTPNREWLVEFEIQDCGVFRNIRVNTTFAINQSGQHQWHYGHELCNFIAYHISCFVIGIKHKSSGVAVGGGSSTRAA